MGFLTRITRHVTYANVMATTAVFLALGGTAWAAGVRVGSAQIIDRSVQGRDIQTGAVGTREVRNGSLGAQDLSQTAIDLLKGARGEQGVAGERGAAGPVGATGPAGAAGAAAFTEGYHNEGFDSTTEFCGELVPAEVNVALTEPSRIFASAVGRVLSTEGDRVNDNNGSYEMEIRSEPVGGGSPGHGFFNYGRGATSNGFYVESALTGFLTSNGAGADGTTVPAGNWRIYVDIVVRGPGGTCGPAGGNIQVGSRLSLLVTEAAAS